MRGALTPLIVSLQGEGDAEAGAFLFEGGLRDAGSRLDGVRRFNELDAAIIAMRRKMNALSTAGRFEEDIPQYVSFYSSMAGLRKADAYAAMQNTVAAHRELAKFRSSPAYQTMDGKTSYAFVLRHRDLLQRQMGRGHHRLPECSHAHGRIAV